MHIYLLSKHDPEMSRQEVLALAGDNKHRMSGNLLFMDELIDYKRLAYTKKVYQLLFSTTKDRLVDDLKLFGFNEHFEESFKLEVKNNEDFEVSYLADIIWDKLDNPKADMKDPSTIFEILFHDEVYVCKLLFEQTEKFEERKPHFRPFNHPTGLHPRLARFMVNLAGSGSIIDPFCGAGGILIEAGLVGVGFQGYDLDPVMVKRCRGNLKHYNLDLNVKEQNALELETSGEAIVTDLPYGKNSKAEDLDQLFKRFFQIAQSLTSKMVIAMPDFLEHENFLSGWRLEETFNYYLHKSLSKKILLLIKDR